MIDLINIDCAYRLYWPVQSAIPKSSCNIEVSWSFSVVIYVKQNDIIIIVASALHFFTIWKETNIVVSLKNIKIAIRIHGCIRF